MKLAHVVEQASPGSGELLGRVYYLAYYAPWDNLAIFYQDGPAPSGDLLILGHLDVPVEQLARAEQITIESAT